MQSGAYMQIILWECKKINVGDSEKLFLELKVLTARCFSSLLHAENFIICICISSDLYFLHSYAQGCKFSVLIQIVYHWEVIHFFMLFTVTVVSPVKFIYVIFKYNKNDWLRNRFYYVLGWNYMKNITKCKGNWWHFISCIS